MFCIYINSPLSNYRSGIEHDTRNISFRSVSDHIGSSVTYLSLGSHSYISALGFTEPVGKFFALGSSYISSFEFSLTSLSLGPQNHISLLVFSVSHVTSLSLVSSNHISSVGFSGPLVKSLPSGFSEPQVKFLPFGSQSQVMSHP